MAPAEEKDHQIFRAEIARLKQKLERSRQIIPVGHDGRSGGAVTCPPALASGPWP